LYIHPKSFFVSPTFLQQSLLLPFHSTINTFSLHLRSLFVILHFRSFLGNFTIIPSSILFQSPTIDLDISCLHLSFLLVKFLFFSTPSFPIVFLLFSTSLSCHHYSFTFILMHTRPLFFIAPTFHSLFYFIFLVALPLFTQYFTFIPPSLPLNYLIILYLFYLHSIFILPSFYLHSTFLPPLFWFIIKSFACHFIFISLVLTLYFISLFSKPPSYLFLFLFILVNSIFYLKNLI
jgi:hypothetical protein